MTAISKNPKESLQKLIDSLSSDADKAVSEYSRLHDLLVRFFVLKGDKDANEAADETFDRVMKKIAEGEEIENLQKYCFSVARFIFLERLRHSTKEAKAIETFHEKNPPQSEQTSDDFQFLRECFNELQTTEKKLLEKYFADVPYSDLNGIREKISSDEGISMNNLRLKIFRLRKRLEDCVKNKLK